MKKPSWAVWMLLCMMSAALISLPVWADEKTNATDSKPADSAQEKEDLWQEVSFDPEKDLRLTEKQIDKIMQDIKQSDPAKAEQLAKLKQTDPQGFANAIREEIQKQVEAAKQPYPELDPRWKERIERRHEEFLAWFKEHYPEEYLELVQVQKSDPEQFAQDILDRMHIYGRIQWIEKRNPELAAAMKKNLELQKQRDALLLQIRISPEEEQGKLIEALKNVVSQRFDTIVQEKQLQFKWLDERLKELSQKLQTRATELDTLEKTKEQSVQVRMKELIERTENVHWN